jgi:hypothetical protein
MNNEYHNSSQLTRMAQTDPTVHFQDRDDLFSYPRCARKHGIETPTDFWEFWTLYYKSPPHVQRAFHTYPNFKTNTLLLWKILYSAADDRGILNMIDKETDSNRDNHTLHSRHHKKSA